MNCLKEYWDESYSSSDLKLNYDNWLDKYDAFLSKARDTPIIDLGCGIGNNSLYLFERNYQVISCDISSEALNKLKQFIPQADTREFDLTEGLPFGDTFTNIIIADLSLHYFSEEMTLQILKDIHRVLKVNGVLLCRVNSTQELINNYKSLDANKYFVETDGIRRRFFDEDEIHYYFDELIWEYMNIQEYEMNRYCKPKTLWEIAIIKKE
jgi:SAM-dependent methyltransferase